jgi:hypothetical protein
MLTQLDIENAIRDCRTLADRIDDYGDAESVRSKLREVHRLLHITGREPAEAQLRLASNQLCDLRAADVRELWWMDTPAKRPLNLPRYGGIALLS